MHFSKGMTVSTRGERFSIVDIEMISGYAKPLYKFVLRGLDGEFRGQEIAVLHPIEDVQAEKVPDLSLEKPGRLARFLLLHDVFRLELSPPGDVLVGAIRSKINLEPYQYVPAMRALELPRPRLLLADDVGLGKTIEAGLILKDLAIRRRAQRVLIVTPAGIMNQWQEELQNKFGFRFKIFDSDTIHEIRKELELGTNPWAVESKVIASMDFIKRREGAFRELSSTKWDVVIVDEAHHIAAGRSEDDISDRHRLGRWLSEATDALLLLTATPHDGYDESFESLLSLLEPNLASYDGGLRYERYQRYLVRRLKRHIKKEDGQDKFIPRKVIPIPVSLNSAEAALHNAVLYQVNELEKIAAQTRQKIDAEAVRLVAAVLRKRAASSRNALAETLTQRRANLEEKLEDLELQRDHLRALRRGDTIPDEALRRLEREIHQSYLSVIRRFGTKLRRAEEEISAIDNLSELLKHCQETPESKMMALIKQLRTIHSDSPTEKVIIFTEYLDTALSIFKALQASEGYENRSCLLSGDKPPRERSRILSDFTSPECLILISTDAGGEGLNLQKNCHRIIHFELPWNPNRLEQRNGRIDRYGQDNTPIIGFLYAQDTYEGEVLARLVDKIERQILKLGSVGDVLGQLQSERIEEILSRPYSSLAEAIHRAEQEIDDEIARIDVPTLYSRLGAGNIDDQEVERAKDAEQKGRAESVDLADFLCRAVTATPGGSAVKGDKIQVWTPPDWQSAKIHPYYEIIPFVIGQDSHEGDPEFIDENHPLLKEAIRWVKRSRFNPQDDHRLAYACSEGILKPDLIATFLVQLRDGIGIEIERLEAIRVASEGTPSRDRDADLACLGTESQRNVRPEILTQIFDSWWQQARDSAFLEAQRRAESWLRSIIVLRQLDQEYLRQELDSWNLASRKAIINTAEKDPQRSLFGGPELPPAIRRRLRHHEERYHQRLEFLEQRIRFDDPRIEPIGVLLRVPANLA